MGSSLSFEFLLASCHRLIFVLSCLWRQYRIGFELSGPLCHFFLLSNITHLFASIMMRVLAVLVLALAASVAPAAAQSLGDLPPCVGQLLMLPSSQDPRCVRALLYIADIYSQFQGGNFSADNFNASSINRTVLCDCAVLYNSQDLKQGARGERGGGGSACRLAKYLHRWHRL